MKYHAITIEYYKLHPRTKVNHLTRIISMLSLLLAHYIHIKFLTYTCCSWL